MDPNEALNRIRDGVRSVNIANDTGSAENPVDAERMAITACNLAEAIDSLDTWLTMGGFLPEAWSRPVAHRVAEALEAEQPDGTVIGEHERSIIRDALEGSA